MWHSSPIFLWIPVDSNSLPLLEETLTISDRDILAITMKNTPFVLAGARDVLFRCRTWTAQARGSKQQPRRGIWEQDKQALLSFDNTLDQGSKTISNQSAQRKKNKKTWCYGNPMPPQKILSFGKSGSKHIFGNHSSSPGKLVSENCRRWVPFHTVS